jgi:hypothetical protein
VLVVWIVLGAALSLFLLVWPINRGYRMAREQKERDRQEIERRQDEPPRQD